MTAQTLHMKVRIQLADYASNRYHIDLAHSPVPVVLKDLFAPAFWAHHSAKLLEGDLVRVVGARREFDLMLVVTSKAPGGLIVEPWPRPAQGSDAWNALMKASAEAQTFTKEELANELAPLKKGAAKTEPAS